MAVTEEKKFKTVEEFLAEELNLSLEDFMDKNVRRTLKTELDVVLMVIPPHHYAVEASTVLKKGVDIRILGHGPYGKNPMGYTNYILVELFDTPIKLRPLKCYLENVVKAIK